MKKILAFLSVLAMLLSFGMAFSVTGEISTLFGADDDTYFTLTYDTFTFRYSLDQEYNVAPVVINEELIVEIPSGTATTNYIYEGTNTSGDVYEIEVVDDDPTEMVVNPGFDVTAPGKISISDYKLSDAMTVGVDIGMNYGSKNTDTKLTNANETNSYVGSYMSFKIGPSLSYTLSDTMTLSTKDIYIGYWSGSALYIEAGTFTNSLKIINPLECMGFGAALEVKLGDTLTVTPGITYATETKNYEMDALSVMGGITNIANDNDTVITGYGDVAYTGMGDLLIQPTFVMTSKSYSDVEGSELTTDIGSQMEFNLALGEDNDQLNLGPLTLEDCVASVGMILSSAYTKIETNALTTNAYAFSKTYINVGSPTITYPIDDTFAVKAIALITLDQSGYSEKMLPAGTNVWTTNTTIIDIGAGVDIAIAPMTTVHAGLEYIQTTTIDNILGDSAGTNTTTVANTKIQRVPIIECGGEKTIIEGLTVDFSISTEVVLSDTTTTTYVPVSAGQGGTEIEGTGLAFTSPEPSATIKYDKDGIYLEFSMNNADNPTDAVYGVQAKYTF